MLLADQTPDPLKTELEIELRDCVLKYQEKYGVNIIRVNFEFFKQQINEDPRVGTNFDAKIEVIV